MVKNPIITKNTFSQEAVPMTTIACKLHLENKLKRKKIMC